MKGQVQNMTLLFGSLIPPCSLSCPEANGKAMEKPWESHGTAVVHTGSRHCPATLGHPQRHKQWHLGSLSSVQQPSLFLTFNGQLYSFQMFFSPGGIEGQQVRGRFGEQVQVYCCNMTVFVAAVLTHALRLLCQDQSDQQGRFSL